MEGGAARRGGRGRHRLEAGVEFNRIVAFSDGVFAIAITLLVLNLDIPSGADLSSALRSDSDDFLAYAISFAVLGRFWLAHHALFSEIERFDRGLMALNLFYLAWVALVPFASGVLGEFSGNADAIAVYAIILAALSITEDLLDVYAVRAGLTTEAGAARQRSAGLAFRFVVPAIFLAAIPLALVSPDNAPLIWLAIFPASVWLGRRGSAVHS